MTASDAVLDADIGRGPGRPRTPEHDERILAAVVNMVDRGVPITVNAVVEASGVSRAALYRRWPSMTELISTALDRGRASITLDLSKSMKDAFIDLLFADHRSTRGAEYSDRRFRKRLELVMQNPDLQAAYWQSHVHRRRRGMIAALQEGIARGELRADLDLEAALDGIIGVIYYQFVARGASLDAPQTVQRCRTAFELIWSGMTA